MSSIQERLETLLEPSVSNLGCELWGLQYITGGKRCVLRIYIDKEDGVQLDDCERVSRQVSSVLDVEDVIKSEFVLEVSSPGFDRPLFKLAHFQSNIGQKIAVKLRMAFDGRRNFAGLLKGIEGEDVVVQVDNEEYLLPYPLIEKANVVPRY